MALDTLRYNPKTKSSELPVPFILKYNGRFDLDRLYRKMAAWSMENGFYFEEKSYKHKVPSPAGAEDEIKWSGWRKITDYFKYHIFVDIYLFDLKDVEVVQNGEKKKLVKARMQIIFRLKLEDDFSGRFTGSQFNEWLRKVYDKYVIKKMRDVLWEDEIYYQLIKIQTVAKEELDMQAKTNAYYDMW